MDHSSRSIFFNSPVPFTMAKRTTTLDLTLPPQDPAVPVYRWLCDALRSDILQGRLKPGARLPSTRDLGVQYRLSRGPIVLAFEQLRSEGYTQGSVGSGTYVNRTLPDSLLHVAPQAEMELPVQSRRRRRLSSWSALRGLGKTRARRSPPRTA